MDNSRLRVLYLTINPNRQSTTVPTENWFKYLMPKGLCPILVSDVLGDFHQWAKSLNIPSYRVPVCFPNKKNPIPFLKSFLKLLYLCKKFSIQIIHCNEHNVFPLAKYVSNILKLPIIVSVHYPLGHNFVLWAFKNSTYLRKVYFVSLETLKKSKLSFSGLVSESILDVLPNCIDTDRFCPSSELREQYRKKYFKTHEIFLVGSACALQPRKQIEHIIDAIEKISRSDIYFLLAGGFLRQYQSYGKWLVDYAKKKLGNNFIYLGHLNDLRGFYNALDLYVAASQEEALPISILEALSSGCPIVSYPSKSGIIQILENNVGILVPQDDKNSMAAAILEFYKDKNLRNVCSSNARKLALDFYSVPVVSDKLWKDYFFALGRKQM